MPHKSHNPLINPFKDTTDAIFPRLLWLLKPPQFEHHPRPSMSRDLPPPLYSDKLAEFLVLGLASRLEAHTFWSRCNGCSGPSMAQGAVLLALRIAADDSNLISLSSRRLC